MKEFLSKPKNFNLLVAVQKKAIQSQWDVTHKISWQSDT